MPSSHLSPLRRRLRAPFISLFAAATLALLPPGAQALSAKVATDLQKVVDAAVKQAYGSVGSPGNKVISALGADVQSAGGQWSWLARSSPTLAGARGAAQKADLALMTQWQGFYDPALLWVDKRTSRTRIAWRTGYSNLFPKGAVEVAQGNTTMVTAGMRSLVERVGTSSLTKASGVFTPTTKLAGWAGSGGTTASTDPRQKTLLGEP